MKECPIDGKWYDRYIGVYGGIGFYCDTDKDIDAVLRCHFVPVTGGGIGGYGWDWKVGGLIVDHSSLHVKVSKSLKP